MAGDMIHINFLGVLFTAKTTLPFMKETQGHLPMTGSAAGGIHLKGIAGCPRRVWTWC